LKPKKLTLISLVLLATILTGTGAIIALSASDIKAKVKWDPKSYLWDNSPPAPWNAEVQLPSYTPDQIDAATILLEGMYSPSATPYPAPHGPKLWVPFDGWDVKAAIEPKLPWHMGIVMPGRYKIELEITGSLLPEYGGEIFRGTGTIHVIIPESNG
jgi:hypothetical protein